MTDSSRERINGIVTSRGIRLHRNEDIMPPSQLDAAVGMLLDSFKKFMPQTPTLDARVLTYNGSVGEIIIKVSAKPGESSQISVISPDFGIQRNTPLAVRLATLQLNGLQTERFPKADYEDLLRIYSNPKPPVG